MIRRRHANLLFAAAALPARAGLLRRQDAADSPQPPPMPFDATPLPAPLTDACAQEARLVRALARLKGGALKVAAIGGSITTGYAATSPPDQGWAGLTAAWLQGMAKARGGRLEFVNLGLSGTDSAAGAQRVAAQALDTGVDLLIVEFGVNDLALDAAVRARSYEGLLRQALRAKQHPAVLTLHLTLQHGREAEASALHQAIAAHYDLARVDFAAWVHAQRLDWAELYDEPVHPNTAGHRAIARAVCATLAAAAAAPPPVGELASLPPPLHDSEFESVRSFGWRGLVTAAAVDAGPGLQVLQRRGFVRGGEAHPEAALRPAAPPEGWTTTRDDAALDLLVRGRQILLWHPTSEHYRNLEAWVDNGPRVPVRGHDPSRRGYLGWAVTPIALDLEDDLHLLHVRVRDDEWRGSGRSATIAAVHTAGVAGRAPARFDELDDAMEESGWALHPAGRAQLTSVTRPDPDLPELPLLAWTHAQVRARFTGTRLGLRLQALLGTPWFELRIDGRRHRLGLVPGSTRDYLLREPLAEGEHELELTKRTEASSTQARLHGLLLAPGARLLTPPAPRPLRIELYGDSISAGACNGDAGADQYDDLSTHDGTRSYGALAARALGADYLAMAVSGIGISASWADAPRLPELFDRLLPTPSAPRVSAGEPGQRAPDVLVLNLGQNDQGWTQAQGRHFPFDYRARYVALVRALRIRHPQAHIVCALGGMTGWRASAALLHEWQAAVDELRAQDTRVHRLLFQACTDNHPRIDTHARLAQELERFLRDEVLRGAGGGA